MSTCCYIAMVQDNGEVVESRVNSDGGLWKRGVADILLRYYSKKRRVKKLLSLGKLSNLGQKLIPNPKYAHNVDYDGVKPRMKVYVDYWKKKIEVNRQPNTTTAYHRDRGEDFMQNTYTNKYHWAKDFQGDSETLGFIFNKGQWYICCGGFVSKLDSSMLS